MEGFPARGENGKLISQFPVNYEPSTALPDGAAATTAVVTEAPNPNQQWAITLDGTIAGKATVSLSSF
jgi:hypothetical protein